MGNIEPGLYLVSTPIGNLEDITLRAIKVLKSVDLIAAEDTRRTRILLNAHCIKAKLISFHDHNKERRAPELIGKLQERGTVAIVSEAGTPGISDPGYYVVKLALAQNIPVFPIPGACSIIAALVASGLPTDRFLFEGFLPRKAGKRRARLEQLADEPRTIILFESPQRLLRTLDEMKDIIGNRECVIAREITKKFEEWRRGRLEEIILYYEKKGTKGEFVILLKGKESDS
ncbi:16S rRNA (cytidine(1402)-2'-O)-methyltransferase [candidate division TA06 bacterium]|uniref:Ribosomal RNA small subunit methyltransferase I n=1 Tax=candidate division TA06 bacterium TaxID=2250710 RepID=A0A523XIX2_UNCT6|nr:MAG: 16S rRNA (cytidine(1402)-2'-O)-methyltransferase [candidate division TA06 bacterium]